MQSTSENLNSISGCTAGRGMGRLSDGVAPRRRCPLDAGRCCGLRGCNVRPPSVRFHLAFEMSQTFVFMCLGQVVCRHLWSYRAVRGLYGRVARQYTLIRGLRGVCRPLSSVRGWPVWRPLERYFQGTKPGNRDVVPLGEPETL